MDGGTPAGKLETLAGKSLTLCLVGSRQYVRAVDILVGMQDLARTSGIDIRFLKPVDCHLTISLAKRDKPLALARVHIAPLNTHIYLMGDDTTPLRNVDEIALPAHEVATSNDGTVFDFRFAAPPDRDALLQTVFAQYQESSGQKFIVRRLAAKAGDMPDCSIVRLTVDKQKSAARGCFASISENGVTLFDIWFQSRFAQH